MSQVLVKAFAAAKRGTAATVARELDVTPQTVSKWSKGETTPDRDRWPELERLLGLGPGALMAAHREGLTQQSTADGIPSAVADALRRLGAELRQLRDEVDELRAELHEPVRSSDPAPPGPASKR